MAAAVALLLFGGITALLSLQLPVGSLRGPGSGFFPLALGLTLMALAGAHILQLHYAPSTPATEPEAPRGPAGSTGRVVRFVGVVAIVSLAIGPRTFRPSIWGKLATATYIVTSVVIMYYNYRREQALVVDIFLWASLALTLISGIDYFIRLRRLINEPAE